MLPKMNVAKQETFQQSELKNLICTNMEHILQDLATSLECLILPKY